MGLIVLRYGELALKGRNRNEFVRRLRQNVRACLKAHGATGTVYSAGQRVFVRSDQSEELLDPLSRVFGLVSLSPVAQVTRDMPAIVAECVSQARAARVGPGMRFRVRARRADKTLPCTSPEIGRLAGEAILTELGGEVDLSDRAQVTIGVEVSYDAVLVYGCVIAGCGGLPLGVEGRVVALISGGIDSPVAAWLMMKRGCAVIPLHMAQNETEKGKALDNIALLQRYSYGWQLRPTVLDHGEIVSPTLRQLRELGEERWSCVFCKRAMLLKACAIAEELGAHAIVLGDSLGQVASQTLSNMEVISHGIPKMILRPLIGLDKTEVVELARRIGTYEISTRAAENCPFLPPHPLTAGTLTKLKEISSRLRDAKGSPAAGEAGEDEAL